MGITYRDNVSPRLEKITPNMRTALAGGVVESLSNATSVIRKQVAAATTRTGLLRASGGAPQFSPRPAWFAHRGPGRIESGRMLASARWTSQERAGGVTGTAGFINPPRYTALQEEGSPGARGVPAMRAFALGHTKMRATFSDVMTRRTASALRQAELNRIVRRNF